MNCLLEKNEMVWSAPEAINKIFTAWRAILKKFQGKNA